ncbi:putative cyclic-di-GMP phosphodiesterase AdrB [compost metagenome]
MVRCVIELCREYRISVIAEGVETLEQAQWLQANGCEFMQGFLLAHPMTAGDAGEFPRFFDWQQV